MSFLKWVSPTVTGTAQLQSMVDFRKGILKRMKYHPDFPDLLKLVNWEYSMDSKLKIITLPKSTHLNSTEYFL